MAGNPLREGFREVLRDPALLLIEVGWRWTFGLIAVLVCAAVALLTTKGIRANPQTLDAMSRMSPWELAQSLASFLAAVAGTLVRVGLFAVLSLACCWIVLSALGRRATLLRPALAPGADLRSCFGVSTIRATITLGALLAWILTGFIAGMAGAVSTNNGIPNLGLILLIVLPAALVIVGVWSAANWYLSLAPLFDEEAWAQSVRRVWALIARRRDEVLEISIALAVTRFISLIVALVLSFAVSAIVTNLRILVADLLAIALLYFFVADFVSIARLAAFAQLRDMELQPANQQQPTYAADAIPADFLARSNAKAGSETF